MSRHMLTLIIISSLYSLLWCYSGPIGGVPGVVIDGNIVTDAGYASVSGSASNAAPGSPLAAQINTSLQAAAWVAANTNDATFNNSVAVGVSNTVTGHRSVVVGNNNIMAGNGGMAIGSFNQATGDGSAAFGNEVVANGLNSFTAGQSNTADGVSSMAVGANAHADHDNSFVWSDGTSLTSATSRSFSIRAENGLRIFGDTHIMGDVYAYSAYVTNVYVTNLWYTFTNLNVNGNGYIAGTLTVSNGLTLGGVTRSNWPTEISWGLLTGTISAQTDLWSYLSWIQASSNTVASNTSWIVGNSNNIQSATNDSLQTVVNRGNTVTSSVYLAHSGVGDAVLAIGTNSGAAAKLYVKGVNGTLTNVPLVLIEGSNGRNNDFLQITGNGGSTTNTRVLKDGSFSNSVSITTPILNCSTLQINNTNVISTPAQNVAGSNNVLIAYGSNIFLWSGSPVLNGVNITNVNNLSVSLSNTLCNAAGLTNIAGLLPDGNLNMNGKAITNFSANYSPYILVGTSNTITLGGIYNYYSWTLTNTSTLYLAPCASNYGASARLDVDTFGKSFTINSGNCITQGLGNVLILTNVGNTLKTYLFDQCYHGTNATLKIGGYQLR